MAEAIGRIADAPLRRFRRYPDYKDPGIKWLQRIPAIWKVQPVKHLASFSTGWTPPTGREDFYGGEYPWANISDLGPRILDTTEKTISDAAIRKVRLRMVETGSLLFSFKLSIGTVSIAGVDMYTNEAIAAFGPSTRMDTGYLFWAAPVLIPHNAQDNIYGAPLLNRERIANAKLLCPPRSEQRAIAAFLDRGTAKIDALVAKKEQLIELLREKRTALITRTVTRGLDPNVPMKDSGVDWLNEIPSHWETPSLGHVTVSRCDGPFGSGLKSEHYSDSGIRVVRLQNIGWADFINLDAAYLDKAYARRLGDHSVKGADILIAGLGDDGHPVGRACVAPVEIEPAMVKADCFRFRLDRQRVLPRYAAFQLSATASAVSGYHATGATRTRMNLTTTARRKIALPPLEEQRAIAIFLGYETAKVDTLVAKVRQAIDHLKEYRTALISAAVTGKIDVRKEAA